MKIWIFDSQHTSERRNWEANFGQPPEEFPNGGLKELSSWEALEEPGIVVIHQSLEAVKKSSDWTKIEVCVKLKRIWVIAVSGAGFGNDSSADKYFYQRRQSVKSGSNSLDASFARCFRIFKEDLEQQLASGDPITPNYALLEPPSAPEALLSLYLCDVASIDLDTQQEAEMLNRAELEFNALVDREQLQPSDKQSWGEILKDRATGIGSLLKKLELKD